jgi:predicted membrane-bound spermidine synthase
VTWYFIFFFLSGFCGILYELVWMRLSMAQFGVTTALISIVLSVFMAGLGAGSWAAGTLVRRRGDQLKAPPLRVYAVAELLIGVSALLVPVELVWGHHFLARMAERAPIASGTYYLVSGTWLALTLISWCACMGATIPLAMFAIRSDRRYETRRSFSFLYLANVLGAAVGAVIPLYLIELLGFHRTLCVGAFLNATIALSAVLLTLAPSSREARVIARPAEATGAEPQAGHWLLVLLFTTGLMTMGMEVIWIRLFTPYVGPQVYSFAIILAAYLMSTFAGSRAYRYWSLRIDRESRLVWISLALVGLLPLITADVRVHMAGLLRILWGVGPFSAVVGFLTPMLVDRWSAGDPDRAGRAYAVNVLGCIVGPLIAGFVLLPLVGERVSMLLFALPWLAMAARPRGLKKLQLAVAYSVVAASGAIFFLTQDFETQFPQRLVLRDSTATVIATGTGMGKRLLVNGVGITLLSPITKMMVHFPLASLDHTPRSALVICFGMGTTFRSAVSWGIPTTGLELVPSVPKLFTYYHPDGAQVLASPWAHVVIDDGRRYLERSPEQYDLITIDPPPPISAAGSSLLYSLDFYKLVKLHLQPGGILAQWLPNGDAAVQSSFSQALRDSFPYVRVFGSVEKRGWHYLASNRPIPKRTAAELLARIPSHAVGDMMEWGAGNGPEGQINLMLSQEVNIGQLIALSPSTPALSDDRPTNEYYLLRRRWQWVQSMLHRRASSEPGHGHGL